MELLSAIEEVKQRLLNKINPQAIVLFGSAAQQKTGPDSDIDLLVVWDEEKHLNNVQRRIKLRNIIGLLDFPLDLLTCSTEELGQAMQDPVCFTAQILRDGEMIYGRLE